MKTEWVTWQLPPHITIPHIQQLSVFCQSCFFSSPVATHLFFFFSGIRIFRTNPTHHIISSINTSDNKKRVFSFTLLWQDLICGTCLNRLRHLQMNESSRGISLPVGTFFLPLPKGSPYWEICTLSRGSKHYWGEVTYCDTADGNVEGIVRTRGWFGVQKWKHFLKSFTLGI